MLVSSSHVFKGMNVELTFKGQKYVRMLTQLAHNIDMNPQFRDIINKFVIMKTETDMVGFMVSLVRILHVTQLP